jgi:hypothetical protein
MIQPYIEVIFNERTWSWAVLGIIYILLGMFIRGIFLNGLFIRLKGAGKTLSHEVRRGYLRRSVAGWLLFFLPMAVFIIFWSRPNIFPITTSDFALFCIGLVSFVLSIILHLRSFAVAVLDAVRKIAEKEGVMGL